MNTSAQPKTSKTLGTILRATTVTAAVAATLIAGTAAADAAAIPKFKQPKVFGTSFQSDPKHDFTKGVSSRHDGILRGWITHYKSGVAEYEPIKWVKGKETEGWFEGPKEGDVMTYASPVSSKFTYYSSLGCKSGEVTVDRKGLGTKLCSKKVGLSLIKKGDHAGLITVYKGEIVKFQEIYTP